ncbi:MAG TPA: type II and III secretion system protein family protein [Caulobacteraceae bacterium]|nr:type II and III secretion system protein family protein [Caulobacteraceae bacterium]
MTPLRPRLSLFLALVLALAVAPFGAGAQSAGGREVAIPQGKSALVQLPVDARDVIITNPSVADVVLQTPRRASILGLKRGSTDAAFFDAGGRRILDLSVRVWPDVGDVAEAINRFIPGAHIRVTGIHDSVILSGDAPTAADSDTAVQIARTMVPGAQGNAGPQVINLIKIAEKDQVMLKVRIVEVQRNIIKQLGFNLQALEGRLGESQFLWSSSPSYGINGAILGGVTGGYHLDTTANGSVAGSNGINKADAAIQAFERVGLVRTLAEPNLTAVSGESAKFLAGGEFPVPTGEDTTGRVSIAFKSFGVGLGFTPVVLTGGRISLKISTEVSELDNTGAFNISTGPGGPTLVVPSLTVRRAETTVELPSGGAMMIAGLLQDTTKQNIDAVPGLKNLPVLGALFRSRDYLAGETELVVIVTPYLVKPVAPGELQTPADNLVTATDRESDLLGKLNQVFHHPPEATAGRTYEGPIGYVVQ